MNSTLFYGLKLLLFCCANCPNFGHLELFQGGLWVSLTWPHWFLSTSLLYGIIRYSSLFVWKEKGKKGEREGVTSKNSDGFFASSLFNSEEISSLWFGGLLGHMNGLWMVKHRRLLPGDLEGKTRAFPSVLSPRERRLLDPQQSFLSLEREDWLKGSSSWQYGFHQREQMGSPSKKGVLGAGWQVRG